MMEERLWLVQPVFDEGDDYGDEWGVGELLYAATKEDAGDLYREFGEGKDLRGVGWLDARLVEDDPNHRCVRHAEEIMRKEGRL